MDLATEAKIWQMHFEDGLPIRRIALSVGIPRATVHRAIQRIEQRTLGELKRNVELVKMRQTLQLESLAAEAIEQWRASCKPRVKRKRRRALLKPGEGQAAGVYGPEVEEVETVGQTGDAALLGEARALMAD